MSKRKIRITKQGSHVNEYERFSKANESIKSSNFEKGNCDYYKLKKNPKYVEIYSIEREKSSVLSLRYYLNTGEYGLKVRTAGSIIFKSSIDNFFDMACMGYQEKSELETIKKMIYKHLNKV